MKSTGIIGGVIISSLSLTGCVQWHSSKFFSRTIIEEPKRYETLNEYQEVPTNNKKKIIELPKTVVVDGKEQVLPYKQNEKMVYTNTETGKPLTNISHKLSLN